MNGVNKKQCRKKIHFYKFIVVIIVFVTYTTIISKALAQPNKNSLPLWEEGFTKTFGIGNYLEGSPSEFLDDIVIILENDDHIAFPYAKQFFKGEYMNPLIILGGQIAEKINKKYNNTSETILFLTPEYPKNFNKDVFLNSLKSFVNISKPECLDRPYLRIITSPKEKSDTAFNEIQQALFNENNNPLFARIHRNDLIEKIFFSVQQECNDKSQGSMLIRNNPENYKIIEKLEMDLNAYSEELSNAQINSYQTIVILTGTASYELAKLSQKYPINKDYIFVIGGPSAQRIYNKACEKNNLNSSQKIDITYFQNDAKKFINELYDDDVVIRDQIRRGQYVLERKRSSHQKFVKTESEFFASLFAH